MTEPQSRWTAVQMIGKGVEAAPALRRGIGATFLLAMLGAGGRVVVQILVQQAIDRGMPNGKVDVGVVTVLGLIGLSVIIVATIAQRTAVARLGRRSEE
ncbi:MAG: ATP-binding cassette, subfamily bacterial, partial [Ilumatobacteraceae bacterium]